MSVKRDAGRGFKKFSVQGRKNADDVIGPCCRSYNSGVLIYGFQELAYDEWDRLYSLDFFLGSS